MTPPSFRLVGAFAATVFAMTALQGRSCAQALSIGVDFGGRDAAGNSVFVGSGTAGVMPQQFWNSVPTLPANNFSGTNVVLFNDNGNGTSNASGVTLSFDGNDGRNSGGPLNTADDRLTYGILKTGTPGIPFFGAPETSTFTLNNVPNGTYKLIAYTNVDSDDDVLADLTLGGITYYTLEQHQFGGSYIQGTSTDPLVRDTYKSNYVQWDGITPNANVLTFTLTWQGGGDGAGLDGFQLVRTDVPAVAPSKIWTGANNGIWDISTTPNWQGPSQTFEQGDEVTFNDSGINKNVVVQAPGGVAPSAITVNNSVGNDYSFSGDPITGVGTPLTKSGAGSLAINNNNNTFTGTTFLRGGTLVVSTVGGANADGALGRGGEIVFGEGATSGTLRYTGTGEAVTRFLTVAGGARIQVENAAANLQFNGDLNGAGPLTKAGPGVLTVSGGGAGFSGALGVEDGTLSVASLSSGNAGVTLGTSAGTAVSRPTLVYTGAGEVSARGLSVLANGSVGGAVSVTSGAADLRLDGSVVANLGPLTKTGPGTLTVAGNVSLTAPVVDQGTLALLNASGTNTISGGVTVNQDAILRTVPTGLGTASVKLQGGTLALRSGASTVISGFGDGSSFVLNQNGPAATANVPAIANDTLQITSELNGEATSVWNKLQQNITAFVAKFTYREASGANVADGAAFVLQNAGLNALGGSGGGLGYAGISPSAALQINVYGNEPTRNGGVGLAYNINGTTPFDAAAPAERAVAPGSINLRSGNAIDFTLSYNGSTLSIALAEQNTTNTYTTTRTTDLQSILGGGSALVGFTGGTGGLNTSQFFSNFQFAGGISSTPETISYGTNVAITAGTTSTIAVEAFTNNVSLGDVSIGAGATLRTTGDANVRLNSTALAGNAVFNVDRRSLFLGNYTTSATPVTLGKLGGGNLVLETSASNPTLPNGSTVNIASGNVVAISDNARPSPLGNATINFSGTGGLVLSSKGGPIVFNNPINVTGNASISARQEGSGVAGPLTVTLPNGLNIPTPSSLTLSTANSYTIAVGGAASGGGTVGVAGGNVTATTNEAFQGLSVNMTPSAGTALLRFTSPTPSVASLASSGAGTSRILLGNSAAPNNTTLTVGGGGVDSRFAGIISNGGGGTVGSLIKTGAENLVLTGNNTFTGGITVNSGVVELGANTAGGTGLVTLNGGTLRFSNPGLQGQYFNNPPANVNNRNPNFVDPATFDAHFDSLGTPLVTAPTTTGGVTAFSFNPDGDTDAPFASQGFTVADNIEARFRGKINVPTTGLYQFSTSSDDGSLLIVDGALVVDNNLFQGINNNVTGSLQLAAGLHDIEIGFYEGAIGAGIIARWQPPGAAMEAIPNLVLSNVNNFAASNVVQMNASSTFDLRGGSAAFSGANNALRMAGGTTLTATEGNLSFASAQFQGGSTFNFDKAAGSLTLGAISDTGAALVINKTGAGNLILRSGANAQLTNAANVINVAGGAVTAVMGAQNPLGASTVNLNGGGLNVSSAGGDVTVANAINVNQSATIAAGNFGGGAVNGPITATIAAGGLNVAPGLTLTTQSSQDYRLNVAGGVSGGGSLVAGAGETALGAAATLNQLTVNGTLSTTSNLAATGGTTINQGGALRFNPGAGFAAAYSGGAIAVNGGNVAVESGVVNLGNAPVNMAPRVATSAPGALQAQVYSGFVNPAGGFGTEQGLANTLARTPSAQVPLTAPLNFGPINGADAAFVNFFGVPTTDAFTAVFSGKFFAPESGEFTFGHSLNDDNAAVFVDLNQNGVFETAGSAGNEQLSLSGCCGNPDPNVASSSGVATLVQGESYKLAVVLQDTGGGSSISAFFQSPSFPRQIIDPGSQSLFSADTVTGGGNVSVGAGAQLLASSLTGASEISMAGGGAVLSLNGAGTVDSAEILRVSNGDSSLELGAGHQFNVGNFTIAGGSRFVKNGTGNMTVTQQSFGAGSTFEVNGGTVDLNGALGAARTADANSGSVLVNASGTVRVNGAITGSVQVSTGGTLGGNGSVGAVTVASGGNLTPGREIGALNSGTLSLAAGANLKLEISSVANHDLVNVTGGVSLDQSNLQLTLAPARNVAIGDLFFIVVNDDTDLVNGVFANAPTSGSQVSIGEGSFEVYYTGDAAGNAFTGGNDIVLRSLFAVPEPTSFGLLAAGAALLGMVRRRRI